MYADPEFVLRAVYLSHVTSSGKFSQPFHFCFVFERVMQCGWKNFSILFHYQCFQCFAMNTTHFKAHVQLRIFVLYDVCTPTRNAV